MTVCKLLGVISRVLMALIFFVSVLFIINNIYNTPNGYTLYQDLLGARGIPGIFAPISILVQLIAGFTLIIGYKIKITAYVLSVYSFVWAIIYFMNALGRAAAIINVTSISCNLWRSSTLSVKPRNWLQY